MKTKKNRTTIVLLITIPAIILLSNTPPAQFFMLERYSYQNADKSFTYTEEPGEPLDFEVGEIRWERFKQQHPQNPNRTLYRTFHIKPWQFWEWWQYIAHYKRFALPYANGQTTKK